MTTDLWKHRVPSSGRRTPDVDEVVAIDAPAAVILGAFFDPDHLSVWWQVERAVTTPRTLGAYALEWAPTEDRDDILGRLGGVFHGTVVQFEPGRKFFVADAYWLPPAGDPIGPMGLEVRCRPEPGRAASTRVHVVQKGFEEGERWRRYYEIVGGGWVRALGSLKMLLE